MAREVVGRVADFVETVAEQPMRPSDRALDLVAEVPGDPPEDPGDLATLLDLVGAGALEAFNTTGPGYLAYIPGGGVVTAALADLYADATNRYVGLAAAAPVLVAIEQSVLAWFARLFGLPDTAQGILTSGGSLANFSAVVAARSQHLGEGVASGTVYVGEHTHASVAKAVRLAGFPEDNVRVVPSGAHHRMDADAVREAVTADRLAGLRPALLVASAGTTNTGSVDPLTALADVAADETLWLHVDAAYGGFFVLTERGRERFRGIERSDSITLDPHKGMFLPYGVGALLVRDGERLRRAHADAAVYLADIQDVYAEAGLPNFSELSPELTRDFRGLRVWLPLHLHGVAAFRAALDEKLDLASVVYEGLVADGRFDVPYEPDLSIVPFRLREADDARNRALLEAINASGRALVSGTVIAGEYWLRVAVLAHRTHRDHIDEFLAIVTDAADRAQAGRTVA